jgi:hypothetical protein
MHITPFRQRRRLAATSVPIPRAPFNHLAA